MGGDITGKAVVPLVKGCGGAYTSQFRRREVRLTTEAEVRSFVQKMRDMGFYPYLTDADEMEVLRQDEARANQVFRLLMLETVQRWVELADERLKGSGIRFFVIPGNDDDYCIDAALSGSVNVINLDGQVVRLDERHEILSLGFSNPTPWGTPRELTESELESRLEELAAQVEDMESCVFNVHCPPFNSGLDECAELDGELNVTYKAGHLVTKPAGSKAVRSALEKYQPLLGLFGHIHEGRGFNRIGRTLCVNPGSDYEEGILNGCLLSLEKGKIQHFQLTAG
ncbi:MAG TPA: hypothetical protein VF297_06870 [Pyrinomonadaceae bacterium]